MSPVESTGEKMYGQLFQKCFSLDGLISVTANYKFSPMSAVIPMPRKIQFPSKEWLMAALEPTAGQVVTNRMVYEHRNFNEVQFPLME